jgi:hypothetical protein
MNFNPAAARIFIGLEYSVKVQSVATGLVFLLLASHAARVLHGQETPSAEQPSGEFFSGTITVLTDDKITVNRAVLGQSSETRTFAITPATKVEGKLRVKLRVTVRFTKDEDVETAVHIIVRATQKK